MKNFEFKNPVKIILGKGEISKLNKEIPKTSKILLTFGGGSIKKNGVYDQVIEALKGYEIVEFGGIEANPDYNTLTKAISVCKKLKIDFILAVGGGSIVDGSKFVAAGAKYDGDSWDFIEKRVPMDSALPLGVIMTMPATSSEMNNGGVVSRRELKLKFPFANETLFPKFSILDPTAVYSIPKKQIGNGIVDIFIHIMEQYLTTTENYMVTDSFSEGLLRNLIDLAPNLISDEQITYETASNYMLIGSMGLNGWVSMGAVQDWATHMIGHELTALKGLDHGETLAIIYPGTMNIMRTEKKDKILQYARNVWGITSDDIKIDVKDDEQAIINLAIEKTEDFFIKVGKKVRLSDYAIGQDTIDLIVDRFEKRNALLGENGIVTPKHVRMILEDRK